MIQVIWEFHVKKGKRKVFEGYYSSKGKWSALFRKSPAYKGTTLVRDTESPDRYILTDTWDDIDAFHRFKRAFQKDYSALDEECEELTEEERCLGFFQAL